MSTSNRAGKGFRPLPGLAVALTLASLMMPAQAQQAGSDQPACSGPRENKVNVRMINGKRAALKDWPGQAAFMWSYAGQQPPLPKMFCGGTIIAPQWVLTAAHCFQDFCDGAKCLVNADGTVEERRFRDRYNIDIVLGTSDLHNIDPENVRRVNSIVIRENFGAAEQSGNDIALVKLDRPWTKGPFPRLSLSLKTDPSAETNGRVMVAGFGLQDPGKSLERFTRGDGSAFEAGSPFLEEVVMPLVPEAVCRSRYQNYHITGGQLCAGYETGRFDACQGDSGGPMMAFDKDGCPFQVGVVSWGEGCAQPKNYGVYTRVSDHEKWIRFHVGKVASVDETTVTSVNLQNVRFSVATSALDDLQQLMGSANNRVRLKLDGVAADNRIRLNAIYKLEIESDVTGKLILIDVNAKGDVTQIFPNQFVEGGDKDIIEKGRKIVVPGEDTGFDGFRAEPPVGKGKVVAIVVPRDFTSAMADPKERRTRGLAPAKVFESETAPLNYMLNLTDEVGKLTKSATGNRLGDMAIAVLDYEIIID